MGRPGEKMEWAEPEGTGGFSIYLNKFQLAQNVLIKRWTYQASKFVNKICMKRV
jgi:hypothetical protein